MKRAALIAATAAFTVASPVHADTADHGERVCYVTAGDEATTIAVVDTFEIVDDWQDVPNVGSTKLFFLPCLPTACPEGYTLVSTACFEHDPFDVPDYGAHPISEPATVSEPAVRVDVGPLVEPSIVGVAS